MGDRMRALTLHQPWSWAVAHAGKRVENRTWAPPASVIGKRIAIHAGMKLDRAAVDDVGALLMRGDDMRLVVDIVRRDAGLVERFVHGAVESVATIAGAITVDCSRAWGNVDTPECIEAVESHWFTGPIGWVLTDVIALPEPVPCKGLQRLWMLPEEVERAVMAQIGGV